MDYRVEELAAETTLPVDTIRYYQNQGLLPPPRRVGRNAIYGEGHLERLDHRASLLELPSRKLKNTRENSRKLEKTQEASNNNSRELDKT